MSELFHAASGTLRPQGQEIPRRKRRDLRRPRRARLPRPVQRVAGASQAKRAPWRADRWPSEAGEGTAPRARPAANLFSSNVDRGWPAGISASRPSSKRTKQITKQTRKLTAKQGGASAKPTVDSLTLRSNRKIQIQTRLREKAPPRGKSTAKQRHTRAARTFPPLPPAVSVALHCLPSLRHPPRGRHADRPRPTCLPRGIHRYRENSGRQLCRPIAGRRGFQTSA